MKRLPAVIVVIAAALVPAATLDVFHLNAQSNDAKPAAPSTEWPTYGHDPGGMRFSPLTQITPANVSQLQVAWVYHMRPAAPTRLRPARALTPRPRAVDAGAAAPAFRRARRRRSSSTASCTSRRRTAASSRSIRRRARRSGSFRCRPAIRPRAASSTWPGDAQTPPQIVFGTATDGSSRSTRRPACRTDGSATTAAST